LCGNALPDPKRRLKGLPSASRMQMVRYFCPAENSQGKWNKTIDSDNGKDGKSDKYLRYSTKAIARTLLEPYQRLTILYQSLKYNTFKHSFV
jgi:hypothetical protein